MFFVLLRAFVKGISLSLTFEATYFRTALLLGLVRGDAVHQWADAAIAREAEPAAALVAVASTSMHDLSGLRDALWPLVVEPDPLEVLHAVLEKAYADLADNRRSEADTVTVLRQFRSMVKLPRPLYDDLGSALVAYAAERDGEARPDGAIAVWLSRFAPPANTDR